MDDTEMATTFNTSGGLDENAATQNPRHREDSDDPLYAPTFAERIASMDKPFQSRRGLNPIRTDELLKEIAEIYSQQDNLKLFKQAVLPLSDVPSSAWEGRGMKPSDVQAIKNEDKMSFSDQPLPLRTTYIMLFMAAIVQGWSQTGTNAANLEWPTDLLHYPDTPSLGQVSCGPRKEHLWVYAGVNAAPYLAASLGCFSSDPISEKFSGRRPAIAVSALLILTAAIGSACANSWHILLGFRILLGLGMGCKASVVPVFMAEIAPAHLRGRLVMNWQVFDTIGILLGFAANVIISRLVDSPHLVWRWQLASLCIPSFALLCGVTFICWDSPRFLMKKEESRKRKWQAMKGRVEAHEFLGLWGFVKSCFMPSFVLPYRSPTVETFRLLRGELILAYKEILLTHVQTLIEIKDDKMTMPTSTHSPPTESRIDDNSAMPNGKYSLPTESRWIDRLYRLWKWPIVHREAKAAAVVMLSQQLCGINVLIFYSSSLYCIADQNSHAADSLVPLMLSLLLGLLNFLCALPAYSWIEKHGRRWLLVFTMPVLIVMMAGAAASFQSPNLDTRLTLVAIFTSLFTVFYSPGLGPVPFTYSSEVFSLEQRMVGMSFAAFVNFLFAGLFTLFVPIIAETKLGNTGLLGIFAGLNALAFILVWKYVPELVGPPDDDELPVSRSRRRPRSMEQLYTTFSFALENWQDYQRAVYIPHVWKCWTHVLTFKSWSSLPVAPDPDYLTYLQRKQQGRMLWG